MSASRRLTGLRPKELCDEMQCSLRRADGIPPQAYLNLLRWSGFELSHFIPPIGVVRVVCAWGRQNDDWTTDIEPTLLSFLHALSGNFGV